jgi:hypothetical protein
VSTKTLDAFASRSFLGLDACGFWSMPKETSSNAPSSCGKKEEQDQPRRPGSVKLSVVRMQNLAAEASRRRTGPLHLSSAQMRAGSLRPESERIEFLLHRDGVEAMRAWVARTSKIYRDELGRPGSYASDATYRPRFEKSLREFEEWLSGVCGS